MYKLRYGITIGQYETMLNSQEGKCLICSSKDSRGPGNLVVDHNHKTGKIRGLLCVPCNLMLGYAKDSYDILSSALSYVKEKENV